MPINLEGCKYSPRHGKGDTHKIEPVDAWVIGDTCT